MSNSTITTILIIVIVGGLVFIGPLITLTGRIDDVAQQEVKAIVEEYVTDILNTGEITRENYQAFENKLNATGELYDIEIELSVLDENMDVKLAQANKDKIGENGYVIYCTTQILPAIGIKVDDQIVGTDDKILMNPGDKISVTAKSVSPTANKSLLNSLFGISSAGEETITASSSGMCKVSGGSK